MQIKIEYVLTVMDKKKLFLDHQRDCFSEQCSLFAKQLSLDPRAENL